MTLALCCLITKSWTPWTVARQAPLSMGFSRQESWSGLPFPPPGDLPDPGIKLGSPALQVDSLPLSHLGSLASPYSENECQSPSMTLRVHYLGSFGRNIISSPFCLQLHCPQAEWLLPWLSFKFQIQCQFFREAFFKQLVFLQLLFIVLPCLIFSRCNTHQNWIIVPNGLSFVSSRTLSAFNYYIPGPFVSARSTCVAWPSELVLLEKTEELTRWTRALYPHTSHTKYLFLLFLQVLKGEWEMSSPLANEEPEAHLVPFSRSPSLWMP